ncbi:24173_t:CDS:2 [Racocetra persica]|uniref:24173_t:CDS:1 n=1 Tax=Racocetra persica TaxID=160502 RepID=A0ACA9KJS5_9GLOM|nr:24173_t:CDS:2 [Racocetra persica]
MDAASSAGTLGPHPVVPLEIPGHLKNYLAKPRPNDKLKEADVQQVGVSSSLWVNLGSIGSSMDRIKAEKAG